MNHQRRNPTEPVKEFRDGRLVVTLWQGGSKRRPLYNVTFGRLYKAEDETQWRIARSVPADQLRRLRRLTRKVERWVLRRRILRRLGFA